MELDTFVEEEVETWNLLNKLLMVYHWGVFMP